MMNFTVDAAGCRYEVVVGPLAKAGRRLGDLARGRSVPVVTDERIWALHGATLSDLLHVEPIFVPEGEAAKSWGQLQRLIARFAELNLDRTSPLLAFGGGSVGDLTGLAASLFKRGCPVVHVPTTLLAQVDSAVGGKTAIDAEGQKNLVGTFHQPALVLADVALLDTLDERQLRAGYAEVVKYALIGHEVLFDWLEDHREAILSGDRTMREEAVSQCFMAKARLVEADPEDRTGLRALLNLGHSFGHAIESAAGLGTVLHGEAVAVGMALAFDFSVAFELCPADDAARVRRHLASAGLPTTIGETGVDRSALLPLIGADKKNEGGRLRLVLTGGIGNAFLAPDVEPERLAGFLANAG
ncbi:3-dehydroquinate synthase [uncultured Sphingomonas sp.]|uniref:3-dehydroquinate synthase n=1 Tax=uncultured Sphingomonas sp. TaxID=158754 RepID=UPI0025E6330B|nr:3-dehydroquinate synthase [uncultured Sphingomonas sp.]